MPQTSQKRRVLITAALIYANGPAHLGHLVETIQADIWARHLRQSGHDCLYLCGSDAHGTPIMLSAKKAALSPEVLVAKNSKQHALDFKDFLVKFDDFHTTNSPENQTRVNQIYTKLQENGDITQKTIDQAFDEQAQQFLPDRFIRGTCPSCRAEDQYGDNCESCGATYAPESLIDPRSTLTGSKPITKQSDHYFFDLKKYQERLKTWINADHVQPQVRNKLQEWLQNDLKPWDISRDAPYFGFEIPNAPGKYFYVWLDAPVGYMASFDHLATTKSDLHFDDYWKDDSKTELYHFIGKDIVYFHTLFWPAMLMSADFRLPTAVHAHGYVTLNGKKMSKSRRNFISARDYLNVLNPEYLRYYYASKLGPNIDDIDFNLDDFTQRIHSDLIGKYINLASRCAGFIHKHFEGRLSSSLPDPEAFEAIRLAKTTIDAYYEERHYNKAMRAIMTLADQANQYINDQTPWTKAKDPETRPLVHGICTQGLNLFRQLTSLLTPVLPLTAERVKDFLKDTSPDSEPLLNQAINEYTPLLTRIPQSAIDTLNDLVKQTDA